MKTDQIKIRLLPDEIKELRGLADSVGASLTGFSALLIRRSLAAIREDEGRFSNLLEFSIKPPATKSKK